MRSPLSFRNERQVFSHTFYQVATGALLLKKRVLAQDLQIFQDDHLAAWGILVGNMWVVWIHYEALINRPLFELLLEQDGAPQDSINTVVQVNVQHGLSFFTLVTYVQHSGGSTLAINSHSSPVRITVLFSLVSMCRKAPDRSVNVSPRPSVASMCPCGKHRFSPWGVVLQYFIYDTPLMPASLWGGLVSLFLEE